jgi:hypothetical protein
VTGESGSTGGRATAGEPGRDGAIAAALLERVERAAGAIVRAGEGLTAVYWGDDAALPRGAAGIDHYESQMGPGFRLHGLTRLALSTGGDGSASLAPEYTAR